MSGGCPHADIRFCPLYLGAHDPELGASCDDGRLGEGGCAVDRGLSYAAVVAKMPVRFIAELAFREDAEAVARHSSEQRSRNMMLLGLH